MKAAPVTLHSFPGEQLWRLIKIVSFGGLFISLSGTFLIWAGSDSFALPSAVWETSLAINLVAFLFSWAAYFCFRGTDKLLGNGILAMIMFFDFFWVFGASTFYFYFLYGGLNNWLRSGVLSGMTALLAYRAYVVSTDISRTFVRKPKLFDAMYVAENGAYSFTRSAGFLLEKVRPKHTSFYAIHVYLAIALAPFTMVLNRLLTPVTGDGHGVFMILAFLTVPMMLLGMEMVVLTAWTMIYLPLKIRKNFKQDVLMKDW